MPIRIYNIVQTGAKIQFGGLKNGLIKVEYHPWMDGKVKNEPMPPAARQTRTKRAAIPISFGFMISFRKLGLYYLPIPSIMS
jgi:hypothetical protein